jgi:uncharacterized membrane protein YccF (DUF307 family)
MSFGTLLPLGVFLASYLVHLTLVGAPAARAINRFGIWLSTFGQDPPGKERLDERKAGEPKKPFAERIRHRAPPGMLERRGRPVGAPLRVLWFLLVGWWLGAIWVVLSWSVLLVPYPFLDTVAALLEDLPSVMTLAYPKSSVIRAAQGDAPTL